MGGPKSLKRVVEAATGVVNIIVAGSAAVGAVALHSWAILAVGGAAYGALVAWDLVSGEKKKTTTLRTTHDPETPKLGDPTDYHDPATQAAVRSILAAKLEIDRILADTPDDVRANLALALTSIDELEERAAAMAARSEDIARYLSTTDPRVAQQDVDQLERRIRETRDPEARAQYQSALYARRELVTTLNDLLGARERIHATMLSIAATLEGLPAKIVRMRALDAQAMDALTGDVKEELDRMNGEIRSFEETLKSLGEVHRT
jgi:hypothetical protein